VIVREPRVSVCQCVSVSVCQCVSVSVCQCVSVSVCQCVSAANGVRRKRELTLIVWSPEPLNKYLSLEHKHSTAFLCPVSVSTHFHPLFGSNLE
jgi:hypothetical protein